MGHLPGECDLAGLRLYPSSPLFILPLRERGGRGIQLPAYCRGGRLVVVGQDCGSEAGEGTEPLGSEPRAGP